MSFRDVRNLIEYNRALGYPRLMSMESFREPNFSLVAEILKWLTERYDPNADLPGDIDTEQDRVLFIKAVAQFMATKANVRLNTKKLYRADGHAVKELLKLTSVLYTAMQTKPGADDSYSSDINVSSFDLTSKVKDLKVTRMLASEITSRGASLYELLGHEVELREERSMAIARPLDIDDIERGLRKNVTSVIEQYNHYLGLIDNLGLDEGNLKSKLDKKQMELERNQKRLRALQGVRPHFMDEYEKLEGELNDQYQVYVDKFRNLNYLEHRLEEMERVEQENLKETEESLRRMKERLDKEQQALDQARGVGFGGDIDTGSSDDDSDDELDMGIDDDGESYGNDRRRPRAAPSGARGNLGGGDSDASLSSDDDDLSQTGSDILNDDDDDLSDEDLSQSYSDEEDDDF